MDATNLVPSDKRYAALAASLLVNFTSIFASTSVVIAAPTIAVSLGGFGEYAWIFSAYILTSSVAIPLAGRLSDHAGRRLFYILGLAVFASGNLACALAPSIWSLIAARALAGLGGGALVSVSQATIGDIFPPRQRAKWFALTMVTFGLGSALGPLGGGYVVALWGWRWVFLANLLPALLSLPLAWWAIPVYGRTGRLEVDWIGALALSVSLLGVIFAITGEGRLGNWETPARVSSALAGLAGLAYFLRHERQAPAPILPTSLFKLPAYRSAVAANLFFAVIFNASITFVPLYVVGVLAAGPELAGRIVLPFMVAHLLAGVATGQVFGRWGGYRPLVALASAGSFAAVAILALGATRPMPEWLLVAAMVLGGGGTGVALPLLAVVIQGSVPYRILGAANSARLFFLGISSVVGIPALTALVMLPLATSGLSVGHATALGSAAAAHGLRDALGIGLRLAFGVCCLFAVAGLVIAVKVPRFELSDTFIEESPPQAQPAHAGAGPADG